jgi:hypothetical protein
MRSLLMLLLVPMFIRGCDPFVVSPVVPGTAVPVLTLCDLNGRPSAVFRSGQDFEMRFSLANLSREDICYSYTAPEMVFKIFAGDSVVATSVDGWMFAQVIIGGCIRAGETYRSRWIAPNAPGREPRISLPPGIYTARAYHAAFSDPRVQALRPVRFTVVR